MLKGASDFVILDPKPLPTEVDSNSSEVATVRCEEAKFNLHPTVVCCHPFCPIISLTNCEHSSPSTATQNGTLGAPGTPS